MLLFSWIFKNFGLFFGPVFLIILFLMIKRLIIVYDHLRHVSTSDDTPFDAVESFAGAPFLTPYFDMLENIVNTGKGSADAVIDALWAEVDYRISIHFTALTGYVNTLILIGFAGTIFGAVGAFNEMFTGLADGKNAVTVFSASWNNGLSTALYTSLGSAVIGGVVLAVICSRYLSARAKRFEIMVSLKINNSLKGESLCEPEEEAAPSPEPKAPVFKILEKTSLPTCSSS